jgi:prepilin-type N-terminal cleavage/methylation domain-containing protein
MNNIKKNVNKGFSLVELIVVIAIMAVLTAVLAPSLLAYVERSRAQKDDSAMAEVTNAVMLALADQNVYDEVLYYTCSDNKSCYIDGTDREADIVKDGVTVYKVADNKIVTKDYTKADKVDQYMYGPNARLDDETEFIFAGVMRGVTITFEPEASTNKAQFILSKGKINGVGLTGNGFSVSNYINGSTNRPGLADPATDMTLSTMASKNDPTNHYLYNRVRATVGDVIELTSQTYRNSDYTIFIRMGTTGGNYADAQDAIMVYGQWNGTNLKYIAPTP